MTEATRVEAKTIHRLAEVDPESGGFKHDADNPLDCNPLVIDEALLQQPEVRCSLGARSHPTLRPRLSTVTGHANRCFDIPETRSRVVSRIGGVGLAAAFEARDTDGPPALRIDEVDTDPREVLPGRHQEPGSEATPEL